MLEQMKTEYDPLPTRALVFHISERQQKDTTIQIHETPSIAPLCVSCTPSTGRETGSLPALVMVANQQTYGQLLFGGTSEQRVN